MAEWRVLRGWSERELERRLDRARRLDRNFDSGYGAMTLERGWNRYHSEAVVAHERPGPPRPDGAFERASTALRNYRFSDPSIVTAHFDPERPLEGRPMLLEIKVLGLRYLSGVVVARVRSERREAESVFGFRYDTLEGHIERGAEWFLLNKNHETGEVRFRIEARWRCPPPRFLIHGDSRFELSWGRTRSRREARGDAR